MRKRNTRPLALVLLLLLSSAIWAQQTYVLSVGICKYEDRNVPNLRCTENDAQQFSELMQKVGAQTTTLLGQNGSRNRILSQLGEIINKATAKDRVIFFFSGHGYKGGLCPYDMKVKGKQNKITYQELLALFRQCQARQKIIFADACYAGGLRISSDQKPQQSIQQADVMFFLSSRNKEVSKEMRFGKNGEFTRYLVRGLGGGADADRNRIITARELFNFVSTAVAKSTQQKQHPVMWGRFDNDMPVIEWTLKE